MLVLSNIWHKKLYYSKSTTIEGNPQLKSYLIRSTIFFKCLVAFCWESLALWGNFHIRNSETSYKIIRLYIIHLSQYQYPCTMYIFTVTGTKLLPPLSMARYVIYYILQDISSTIKMSLVPTLSSSLSITYNLIYKFLETVNAIYRPSVI